MSKKIDIQVDSDLVIVIQALKLRRRHIGKVLESHRGNGNMVEVHTRMTPDKCRATLKRIDCLLDAAETADRNLSTGRGPGIFCVVGERHAITQEKRNETKC